MSTIPPVEQNSIVSFFSNNKKKIFFGTLGISLAVFTYKRFLSDKIEIIKSLYYKMNDYSEMLDGQSKEFSSVTKHFEGSFNNLISKLLAQVEKQIQDHFSLKSCYEETSKTESKEDKIRAWTIFKDRLLMSFYSSVAITRVVLLLSQTHLLLLERLNTQSDNRLLRDFYDSLLSDLWKLALNLIEYQAKWIENRTSQLCKNIFLNRKYNKDEFKAEVRKFRDVIEQIIFKENNVRFTMLEQYLKEVEDKINRLESSEVTNDEAANSRIMGRIRFFCNYYDVCASSLFTTILQKALDYDFEIVDDMIEVNFENLKKDDDGKVAFPKILSFLYHMRSQIMNPEHTLFLIKDYKDNDTVSSDLNKYFKIIYD